MTKLKPVIITGDQGSGKSSLAVEIASKRGKYLNLPMCALLEPFGVGILRNQYNTVIVEGFSLVDPRHMSFAKNVATCATMYANSKGRMRLRINTPLFIFVSDIERLVSDTKKRFTILHVTKGVKHDQQTIL